LAAGHQYRNYDRSVSYGFLIQNSQNRDSAAIQVKLDELIRVGAAQNSLVGIEHLTDEELEDLRKTREARATAGKIGEETVKATGKKAQRAARRAAG
jgi:low affinity Fe/Cu permease